MSQEARILIVEDEEAIQKNLELNLNLEGYSTKVVGDGQSALDTLQQENFDAIILDIMMPKLDGLSVAETLRTRQINTPILFLSAKNTTSDRIEGLKKGGDDYMTKPFDLEELILRVKVLTEKSKLLKAKHKDIPDTYTFGDKNTINFNAQEGVGYNGKEHSLSKTEIHLLKLLIENDGNVVSREHILQVVWGYDVFPHTRTIDNFILGFRKYFEKDSRNPEHFHSIRGVGYKFTS